MRTNQPHANDCLTLLRLGGSMLLICALCGPGTVLAQQTRCRVVDGSTREPLLYATVAVKGTHQGTITNADGRFNLPTELDSDTLVISYVGYRTLTIRAGDIRDGDEIALHASTAQLAAVEIRAGKPPFDRVMAAIRWLARAPVITTRLFFGLETHWGDVPVEIVHAYYNSTLQSARITSLELKQGRIGLTTDESTYFMNFNTSQAFARLDPLSSRSPYPASPLAVIGASELRRFFTVATVSMGSGKDGVDRLRIAARSQQADAFSLDLWLSTGTAEVRALELSCTACATHPFVALLPGGRIERVDLRYKQTWHQGAPAYPEVTELEYTMDYSSGSTRYTFATRGVMHAFAPGAPFQAPLMTYPKHLEDYRRMIWLPDDSLFWNNVHPPLPSAQQERDMEFLRSKDLRRIQWHERLPDACDTLMTRYAIWSGERRVDLQDISIRPMDKEPPGVHRSSITHGHAISMPRDPIRLTAQIYLDFDTLDGRFIHQSATVLDGYRSYDIYQTKAWDAAFHNIWFDLCEIERRRLEQQLQQDDMSPDQARSLHTECMQRIRSMTETYYYDTQYGQAFDGLRPYNEMVKQQLGIDNFSIYGL